VELNVTGGAWDRLAESRWVRPRDAGRKVLTPTRVDAASFTLPGDLTAAFRVNRAVHLLQANEAYGYVASSACASGVTLVAVAGCAVDAGLALVELGLEVEAAPKYGNAANADTLGGSGRAEVIAAAQAGTAADANHLAGKTEAEIVAEALSGTAANASKLEGKTKAEVVAEAVGAVSSLPAGAVIAVASETVPAGYLECNGAAVSRTTYASLYSAIGVIHGSGDGSTTFNLPDYRGRFLRGWDHAAGRDPDKAGRTAMATGGQTGDHVGSVQADQFKSHAHAIDTGSGGSGSYPSASCSSSGSFASGSSGGNETRPVNAGVMYCIKY
jgi:microcystin-dependent protein